jgi:hypothetical protein
MELRIVILNVVLAVFAILPLAILGLAGPIVWTALRTGKLLGRGRNYDRNERPAMYYGGIVFWLVLFALCTFISALVLSYWLSNQSVSLK